MAQRPQHVVVVGAGMVGLATAWFLQERGARVTVVDRTGVMAGSSRGNAGWLAPALTLPLPDPAILATGVLAALKPSSPVYLPPTADPRLLAWLVAFARHCTPAKWRSAMTVFSAANREALAAFDALAVEEPTKHADPFLAAFRTVQDREVLVEEFANVAALGGATDVELLDEASVHALEPALGEQVSCGLRIRGQRFIDPGRYVGSLADAVRERGGEIALASVEKVDRQGAGVVVRTSTGTIAADAVVIAAGAWASRLVRPHGVRAFVQAGRGYSFAVRPQSQPRGPVYFPTQRVACTPLGESGAEDALRVAGMMEFRRPDAPLDPRRIAAIVDAVRPMLTGVNWEARTDEWVGSRPCTADGLPLVGATRTPGVFVAGGHGMWGIALGPLTGRLVADQVMQGRTDPLLRSFDPLR
ncbi:MAG: FAD-dependent oxidoreductase [Aeromicrobium sp.]|uniref:NAD(P)/FAD-dependent oxidoreductase n=1 Tax=Aeromicrobium sp. TaxID=1871063 RepID=UPI00260A59BC|nr:FAD-dependent oxidoreductase [Aeromicrobium sp.]MDF1705357.1 FAD-dependent oxidoreductase [Aeromicrobium sp.]